MGAEILTKREQIAIAAMQGLIAAGECTAYMTAQGLAELAMDYTKALLTELAREQP